MSRQNFHKGETGKEKGGYQAHAAPKAESEYPCAPDVL